MYHSVTFGDKNTWDDWHLVPNSRPVVKPPKPKTKKVDIPGSDGALDFTNSLTGYTYYENRTGSMDFIVVNDLYHPVDTYEAWSETYSKVMNYLHGKKMRMILEDDPTYFYEGRFAVDSWKTEDHYSTITISYDLGPYKWSTISSIDPSYPSATYRNVTIPDSYEGTNWKKIIIDTNDLDEAPVTPNIRISMPEPAPPVITGDITVWIPDFERERVYPYDGNEELVIVVPELIYRKDMSESERTLWLASYHEVLANIEFRKGRL